MDNGHSAKDRAGGIDVASAEWLDCERVIRRFEQAWQSNEPPSIEAFLPTVGGQRETLLLELVHVDFELRQKRGESIYIESYLERFPELRSNRASLRQLVAAEIERRRAGSAEFQLAEYGSRFPELAGELSSLAVHADSTAGGWRSRAGKEDSGKLPELPGFEVLSRLGRGGMGVVYLARQTALKRSVAVKMIRSRSGDEAERGRFRTEIEAAARLAHPNIVQIFEVGEHEGLPYCVLEYVAGGSLDRVLRGQPQSAEVAARLVQQLAAALQHAHERGIVHRDLKPANILLQKSEVRGQNSESTIAAQAELCPLTSDLVPKIADFGLARQLEGIDAGQTETGIIMGTPAYMSPEQAAGQSKDCGPATDIYALGVILYELLTGRPPHQGATVLDTLQQVRSQKPVTPRALAPKTPRDLNTICLKCLHKEPARRYSSARALADDLSAFLEQRPIAARPVGLSERVVMAARRRPLVASLVAAICLITVLGLSAGAYQWRQTSAALALTKVALKSEQEERAAKQAALGKVEEALKSEQAALGKTEEALADTKAFSQFVVNDVLAVARPAGQGGGLGIDVTVREALDAASKNLATRFAGQPRAEAIARLDLGETYGAIGEYGQALTHYQEAARLRRESLGLDDIGTIEAEDRLGTALRQHGKAAEGIALHESLRERVERLRGPDSPSTLAVLYSLVSDYVAAGREDDALRLSEELLPKARAVFGPAHESTLKFMHQLGALLNREGRVSEALPLLQETYERRAEAFGPDNTATLSTLSSLAGIHKKLGHTADALAVFEQNMELTRTKLGPEHFKTLMAMTNVAQTYGELGRWQEAVEMDERAHRIALEKLGPADPRTLILSRQLAHTYERGGREPDGLPIFEETYKQRQKVLGPDHQDTLISQGDLALAYRRAGRLDDAIKLAEETLRSIRDKRGENHPRTIWAMNGLALAYKAAGRASEALPLYEAVVAGLTSRSGSHHADTLTARNNLGGAYFALGRLDEALATNKESLEIGTEKLGPNHPTTLILTHNLGAVYQQAKRNDEALATFRRAYEGRAATLGPDHADTLESMYRVAALLAVRRDFASAEEMLLDCQQRLASSRGAPPTLTKNVATALQTIAKAKGNADNPGP